MAKQIPIERHIEEYTLSKNPFAFLFAPCKDADLHKHCDFYEFSLVTRGSFINEYKGERQLLPKDTLIFFRKEETHTILTDTPLSLHCSFIVETEHFEKEFVKFFPGISLSSLGAYRSCHLSKSQSAFLQDLAFQLSNNNNIQFRGQLAHLFMMTALTNLIMPSHNTPEPRTSSNYYADLLLQQLDDYMYITVPVSEIYLDYPINKVALIQSFKEKTGYTIVQYSTKKKMEYAAQYLSVEKQNVAEIANILNFSSPSHFAKVFQEHYGLTPKKYQQLHCSKSTWQKK